MQDLNDDITDLLVAYALGALEPEEIARVGQLLDERPELRKTLAELRTTADLLPHGLPEARPPADLRQRVLDHAVGRAPAAPAIPPARRLSGWLYALGGLAAAALVALAVALSALSVARQELAIARQELAAANQQLAANRQELAAVLLERDQIAQAIASASSLAELTGDGGRGTVLATAEGGLIVAAQLPALDPAEVYQLWVITGEGAAPRSAGVFRVNQSGFHVLALGPGLAAPGVTLAVTAEPAPAGSPGPTTPILVAGQLT